MLVDPHPRFRSSFLAAWDEFTAAPPDLDGQTNAGTLMGAWNYSGPMFTRAGIATDEGFTRLVAELTAQRDPGRPRPAGLVPQTMLWWVDDDRWLGRIAIRHHLNDRLRQVGGGHIGYAVRPTARGEGHARRMLQAALPTAHALGIDPAEVTCNVAHVASARVIEACGGEFSGERLGKWFYVLPTGARMAT